MKTKLFTTCVHDNNNNTDKTEQKSTYVLILRENKKKT